MKELACVAVTSAVRKTSLRVIPGACGSTRPGTQCGVDVFGSRISLALARDDTLL
jgi:hypothetical protein